MPSCHFVHLILLSSGPKVPKSGPFKNEGIHEGFDPLEGDGRDLTEWGLCDLDRTTIRMSTTCCSPDCFFDHLMRHVPSDKQCEHIHNKGDCDAEPSARKVRCKEANNGDDAVNTHQ